MGKWRGAALGGGVMLAVAGVGLVVSNSMPAAGAGTAEMRVSPVSQNLSIDSGTFDVTIEARDVNNLGSTEFTIAFDNDLLELTAASTGPFLRSTGRTATCTGPSAGPNGETAIETANIYGALSQKCATTGLISEGVGAFGPSGTGVLATLSFKPKAVGMAEIDFVGLGSSYAIYPGKSGKTGLGNVDVCTNTPVADPDANSCAPSSIAVTAQSAVVNIFDPNAPTPAALPATPTTVAAQAAPNARATLVAAGEIRERPSSALSSSGSTTSGGAASPSSAGSGRTGTVNGASGGTSASGALGPDGAPIAGYGPQQQSNPWPERTGAGLAVIGLIAFGSGVLYRRRRVM